MQYKRNNSEGRTVAHKSALETKVLITSVSSICEINLNVGAV